MNTLNQLFFLARIINRYILDLFNSKSCETICFCGMGNWESDRRQRMDGAKFVNVDKYMMNFASSEPSIQIIFCIYNGLFVCFKNDYLHFPFPIWYGSNESILSLYHTAQLEI